MQSDNLPLVDLTPPPASSSDGVREQHARVRELFRAPLAAAQEAGLVRDDLTPQDVRIQLLMLSAVIRPDTSPSDRRRAWRLAEAALGMTSPGKLPRPAHRRPR